MGLGLTPAVEAAVERAADLVLEHDRGAAPDDAYAEGLTADA